MSTLLLFSFVIQCIYGEDQMTEDCFSTVTLKNADRNFDDISVDSLSDIIKNIGVLRLEIPEKILKIMYEIEPTVIEYFRSLHSNGRVSNYSEILIKEGEYFGYRTHLHHMQPFQAEHFLIPDSKIHDENNPFINNDKIIYLMDYMISSALNIFNNLWKKLNLINTDDLKLIFDNKPPKLHFAFVYYNGNNTMNDNGDIDIKHGFIEHRDVQFFVLLKPGKDGGLQIKYNNKWYDIHETNTFMVNFGRLLETTTNGQFKAVRHRVVKQPDQKERLSMLVALDPQYNSMIYKYDENNKLMPYMKWLDFYETMRQNAYGGKLHDG
eukprot:479985_1